MGVPTAPDFIPDTQFTPDSAPTTPSQDFIPDDQFTADEDKFGTPGQQLLSGVEGAAQGFAGPVATGLETGLSKLGVPGLSGDEQRARAEANPWTHGLSEAAGFGAGMLTGTGEAALLTKAGELATHAMPVLTTGAKLAQGAARGAVELGLFQAGDETSRLIQGDPEQSVGSALAHVGLSAALGVGSGGLLTGAGIGISKLLDNPTLKDFADRLAFRKANIDPNEMLKNEADQVINRYHEMNDEVTGPTGLKAQAIQKLLPVDFTPKMSDQVQQMADKAQSAIKQMVDDGVPDRLIKKYNNDYQRFLETATSPQTSVAQQFDALNEFKRNLQDYSKGNFGPFAIPRHHEAFDFLQTTKSLGHDLRVALEDSSVWGKAADIQKELNSSWTKVLPAAKDFTKKFMVKVGDIPEISGDKLTSYVNQAGRAVGTTDKQRILSNFIEGMDKHFKTVDSIYERAGIANPFEPVSMGMLKESLNKPSAGTKLADLWYSKLEAKALGHTAGTAVGGAIGSSLGHGYLGALIGERALGPAFTAIVKPLMEKYPNVDVRAVEHAMNFVRSAQKGEALTTKAAKAVLTGSTKLTSDLVPSSKELEKLDEQTKAYQPTAPTDGGVAHYLPNHGSALAKTTVAAAQYINSQRPHTVRSAPFDAPPKVTEAQQHRFNKVLQVAQQPLSLYHKIAEGTLTGEDVHTLAAIYPALYNKMSAELMTAAVDQIQKGEQVPYRIQQGISLFTGKPLNSVMSPANMQAAQAVFAAQAQQMAARQAKSGEQKGSSKLWNMADEHMTQSQSREQRRNS